MFEAAGFTGLADTKLTIVMDYTSFDDFSVSNGLRARRLCSFLRRIAGSKACSTSRRGDELPILPTAPTALVAFRALLGRSEVLLEVFRTTGGYISARTGFDAWIEVTDVGGWMAERIARLKHHFERQQ